MDHDRVIFPADLATLVPDLFNEGARRVVGVRVDTALLQLRLNLQRGAKGRHDHQIVTFELRPGNELLAACRPDESHSFRLQIGVYVRIVDHLRQQEDPPPRILVQCVVGDLDGVLDTVAESEMTSQFEPDRTKIQTRRTQIPFSGIEHPPRLLNGGNNRASVKSRYAEFSHGWVNAHPLLLVATDEVS